MYSRLLQHVVAACFEIHPLNEFSQAFVGYEALASMHLLGQPLTLILNLDSSVMPGIFCR